MIGVVLSTLFWNQVLDAKLPEPPRAPLRQMRLQWEPKTVKQRNKVFFEQLARPVISEKKEIIPAEITVTPKNILIVAPHPDDEILCCASTIQNHLSVGDRVTVVIVTDGDGKEKGDSQQSLDYGKQRRNESLLAGKKLGLTPKDILFLGFPDSHLAEIEKKGSARSIFTRLVRTMRNSLLPGTPYTWSGLQRSLCKVLKTTEPDVIYFPGQADKHSDHQVVGRAIQKAIDSLDQKPEQKEYVVHASRECIAQPVDTKKLGLIRFFRSQRHDKLHAQFLDKFAECEEKFE